MNLLNKYKLDLMHELLKIIDVHDIEKEIELVTLFTNDKFESDHVVSCFKKMLPCARKLYSSDRLTALHTNAFEKQKNPGLNLIRQIIRENGFDVKSKNIYQGISNSRRIYQRNYYFVHRQPKKKKTKLVLIPKPKNIEHHSSSSSVEEVSVSP